MTGDVTLQRGMASVGYAGPVAFFLVLWTASLGGAFDWSVFWTAFAALALCWARTWVLVPIHRRFVQEQEAEWERYGEQDWHLIDILSAMSGTEIDQLRTDVTQARSEAVRTTLRDKAPTWDDEDRRRFLTYFIEDLSEISTVYVDSNGKIQAFD